MTRWYSTQNGEHAKQPTHTTVTVWCTGPFVKATEMRTEIIRECWEESHGKGALICHALQRNAATYNRPVEGLRQQQ